MLPKPVPVDEPVLELIEPVRTDQATFVSAGKVVLQLPDPFPYF